MELYKNYNNHRYFNRFYQNQDRHQWELALLAGATGLSAISGLIGGQRVASATESAASTQANAALTAARVQAEEDRRNRELQQLYHEREVVALRPYVGTGAQSLNRLRYLMGLPQAPISSQTTTEPTLIGSGTTAPQDEYDRLTPNQLLNIINRPGLGGHGGAGRITLGDFDDPDYVARFRQSTYGQEVEPVIDKLMQLPPLAQLRPDEPIYTQLPAAAIPSTTTPTTTATTTEPILAGTPEEFGQLSRPHEYADIKRYAPLLPEESALEKYKKPFEFTFEKEPGHEFRKFSGEEALQRKQAATGDLLSGGAVKELLRYNQDFATGEYGNAFARAFTTYKDYVDSLRNDIRQGIAGYEGFKTDIYNKLLQMSGMGQSAITQTPTPTFVPSSATSTGILQAGTASAQGQIGSANALRDMYRELANTGMSAASTYLDYTRAQQNEQRWNQLFSLYSGGGGPKPLAPYTFTQPTTTEKYRLLTESDYGSFR